MKPLIYKNKDYRSINLGMFNYIKGIAVLALLFGHLADMAHLAAFGDETSWVRALIHNPVIPLFYIISGYGFTPGRRKGSLRRQLSSLWKTYTVTGICVVGGVLLTGRFFLPSWKETAIRSAQYAVGIILGLSYDLTVNGHYYGFGSGTVWYLVSLMECIILSSFLMKRFHEKTVGVISVLMTAAGCAAGCFIKLPFAIIPTAVGMGYFYLGYMLRRISFFRDTAPGKKSALRPILVIVLLILSVLSVQNGVFNLATCVWGRCPLGFLPAGAFGFLLVWAGVRVTSWEFPLKSAVMWLGHHSLVLIGIDTVAEHVLFWDRFSKMMPFPLLLLLFAGIIAICYGLTELYRRLSNRIGFGR